MRRIRLSPSEMVKVNLLGATSFWLPDTVLHAVRGNSLSDHDVLIVTVLMPLTFLATLMARKRLRKERRPGAIGFFMLAGVWLFGGFFMMLHNGALGAVLSSPEVVRSLIVPLLLSLVPVYTLYLAIWDGSAVALVLVTIGCGVVWTMQQRLPVAAKVGPTRADHTVDYRESSGFKEER